MTTLPLDNLRVRVTCKECGYVMELAAAEADEYFPAMCPPAGEEDSQTGLSIQPLPPDHPPLQTPCPNCASDLSSTVYTAGCRVQFSAFVMFARALEGLRVCGAEVAFIVPEPQPSTP